MTSIETLLKETESIRCDQFKLAYAYYTALKDLQLSILSYPTWELLDENIIQPTILELEKSYGFERQ